MHRQGSDPASIYRQQAPINPYIRPGRGHGNSAVRSIATAPNKASASDATSRSNLLKLSLDASSDDNTISISSKRNRFAPLQDDDGSVTSQGDPTSVTPQGDRVKFAEVLDEGSRLLYGDSGSTRIYSLLLTGLIAL